MKKQTAVYLRVSTLDQENGLMSQRRALKDYCTNHNMDNLKWYSDRLSGKDTNRPAFKELQKDIFAGKVDTVVCWKLDRLSRSLQDRVNILCNWLKKDIRIIAITQQLDFSGTIGKIIATVMYGLAEMSRENLRENTKRGLIAAKAKGSKLGKRPRIFAKDIVPLVKKGMTIQAIADKFKVTKPAIYNCLERENVDLAKLRRRMAVT